MPGRHRNPKRLGAAIARQRNAPPGYSSAYTAREAAVLRAASAAKLRALVAVAGESVEITWTRDDVRGVGMAGGVDVTRSLLRSWEARGWARLVAVGKGRARLDVDMDTVPEE